MSDCKDRMLNRETLTEVISGRRGPWSALIRPWSPFRKGKGLEIDNATVLVEKGSRAELIDVVDKRREQILAMRAAQTGAGQSLNGG